MSAAIALSPRKPLKIKRGTKSTLYYLPLYKDEVRILGLGEISYVKATIERFDQPESSNEPSS
jgi:hypothetical protein